MQQLYYPSAKLYASLKDDKREYFYEEGLLKTSESYQEGRREGEALLFWPCGTLKRRCHFHQGMRHGLDQMWDEAGDLVDEGHYEKGRPIGFHRRWKGSRLIEEVEYFADGRLNVREWDELGEIRVEAVWKEDEYQERVWDRFQKVWVEKQGYWNGKKLIYRG